MKKLFILLLLQNLIFAQKKLDSTELVFTRNPFYFPPAGIFYKAKIKNNDTTILKIMQNQQRSVFVKSGQVNLSAKNLVKTKLSFESSSDTIYYINVSIGGLFLHKINLKITKKIGKLK